MLAIERRNRILSMLEEKKSVLVSELSLEFSVTEETIRRDLEKLEKEGFAKKTYGGAVLRDNTNLDVPFPARRRANIEEKNLIAVKTAELIEDGESLMLDCSSTALALARQLKNKKRLTVITNSVEILLELSDGDGVTCISTGGTLRHSSLSLVGRNAERMVSNFYVDKAIISCKGIDVNKAATDSNEMEVDVKRAMINSAKQIILVADSSKFDRISFTKLIDFEDIDVLASDKQLDEDWQRICSENNIEVI